MFKRKYDSTGASNVSRAIAVPATAPTVRSRSSCLPAELGGMQCVEVVLSHDRVPHDTALMNVEAVWSCGPKLRPSTVTETPALGVKFATLAPDAKGASKLRASICVPIIALTDSWTVARFVENTFTLQRADVAELQLALVHTAEETAVLAVKSRLPKFSPVTVT